jgi:hypothetical protein
VKRKREITDKKKKSAKVERKKKRLVKEKN